MPTRPEFITEPRRGTGSSTAELALGPDETANTAAIPLTRHRPPLFALTGLRFFAAAYVVTFHTRIAAVCLTAGFPHLSRFFRNGYLAVSLFFILSGFILAYTYRGQISGKGALVRFWEARFARLWPAYAFSLFLSSLSALAVPHWTLAVATLAMVQAWNPWHPELAGTWNFVCWTLSVEAFFYVLFPWVQRGLERLRTPAIAVFGSVSLCIGVLCNVAEHTLSKAQYHPPWDHVPLPVIHLPEFLIGVALGNVFVLRDPDPRRGGIAAARWPLYTTCGVGFSLLALATLRGPLTSVVLLPFILLVTGLALESSLLSNFLSRPALLLGGAISYSMYLLQTPVRTLLSARYSTKIGLPELAFVPVTLVPMAYLAYRFVEEPSRLALRRLFAAARSTRTPS